MVEKKLKDTTIQRIAWALVMFTILIVCSLLGFWALSLLILLVGLGIIDEVLTIIRKERFGKEYILFMSFFILFFLLYILIPQNPLIDFLILVSSFVAVILLLIYLFVPGNQFGSYLKKYSFLIPLYIFVTLAALVSLFKTQQGLQFFWPLIAIVASMDIGAWFFGSYFGKRKLWKSVSPSKTIEGAIGGVLSAGLVGTLLYALLFTTPSFALFVLFSLMGAFSHLGDLIESKFKREFDVKDSSNLIPGHGGIYDRVDGLIFLIPLFVFWVASLGLQGP